VRSIAKLWFLGRLGLTGWGGMIDSWAAPFVHFQYREPMSREELARVIDDFMRMAAQKCAATPEGVNVNLHDVPDQTPHAAFQDFYRRAVSKFLLGQDTSQNATQGQQTGATVQGRVRDDLRDEDAALLDASLNESVLAPWCAWNFGPGVAPPTIKHVVKESVNPEQRGRVFESAQRLGLRLKSEQVYGDLGLEMPDGTPEILEPPTAPPTVSAVPPGGPGYLGGFRRDWAPARRASVLGQQSGTPLEAPFKPISTAVRSLAEECSTAEEFRRRLPELIGSGGATLVDTLDQVTFGALCAGRLDTAAKLDRAATVGRRCTCGDAAILAGYWVEAADGSNRWGPFRTRDEAERFGKLTDTPTVVREDPAVSFDDYTPEQERERKAELRQAEKAHARVEQLREQVAQLEADQQRGDQAAQGMRDALQSIDDKIAQQRAKLEQSRRQEELRQQGQPSRATDDTVVVQPARPSAPSEPIPPAPPEVQPAAKAERPRAERAPAPRPRAADAAPVVVRPARPGAAGERIPAPPRKAPPPPGPSGLLGAEFGEGALQRGRFAEAIDSFAQRTDLMPKSEFLELHGENRARAWTVARVAEADVIKDLHGAVGQAIEGGQSWREFEDSLNAVMEQRGWEGLEPWHARLVYQQNVDMAHSAGRVMQATDAGVRYWRKLPSTSAHPRPEHARYDGQVFAFSQKSPPPWDFGCQCPWEVVFDEELTPADRKAAGRDLGGADNLPGADEFEWDASHYFRPVELRRGDYPDELWPVLRSLATDHNALLQPRE